MMASEYGISFWGDETFWNRWWRWLHNIVNVLSATKLSTSTWSGWQISFHVNFATI